MEKCNKIKSNEGILNNYSSIVSDLTQFHFKSIIKLEFIKYEYDKSKPDKPGFAFVRISTHEPLANYKIEKIDSKNNIKKIVMKDIFENLFKKYNQELYPENSSSVLIEENKLFKSYKVIVV